MARYTLIQSGDFNAAENIGALAGDIQREGIVSGLGVSGFDPSVPDIDVAAGKTGHLIDSQTAEATLDDGTTVSEQRDQVQLISHVDPQTVGLTDNTINELYLTPQPAVDDSPNVVATTTGDPTADAVKIGEVDTTTDTVSEQWNLIRADGTLSYPDSDAANTALQSLPTGVAVIDRKNGVRLSNGAISADTLEAGLATHKTDLDEDRTVPAGRGTVISGSLSGSGSISGNGNITIIEEGELRIPNGIIVMWSGDITNVPDGFALCDGTDGTPDLRNRFIAGAGDEYTVGQTGGEKDHQLTESEMPSHSHQYQKASSTVQPETFGSFDVFQTPTADAQTTNKGGDQPHENRPRFFALAFIMKV